MKERVAACEKDGSRCNVASFFEGRKYFEIKQLEIKDVRLVYAPAEGIGVFGGETDNWRWPRHTGDWSYLRAYVGKDGKPAAYDKDNVPYKPKHWLRVAAGGVKPNDLVFVVGYPGRTQRHQTYAEVKETVEWALPRSIRLAEEQLALIDTLTKQNPALAIKLAGRVQGLNNGLTNSRGVLEGMDKGGALAKKQAREQELVAWISASPARQTEVRRGARRDAGAPVAGRGDARTQRRAQPAVVGIVLSRVGADAVPPVGPAPEGRRRAGPGLPGTRLAAHPRGSGPAAAHDRSRRGSRAAPLGARRRRPRCLPASGSKRWTGGRG